MIDDLSWTKGKVLVSRSCPPDLHRVIHKSDEAMRPAERRAAEPKIEIGVPIGEPTHLGIRTIVAGNLRLIWKQPVHGPD